MKRAVQFQNFGLDLAQLPKLLEFATKRAQQTGQSVDYLVDSIVTGLGRKSVLNLENHGISSSRLNAEIAKTGDFFGSVGNIVDKELVKMGDHLETNVTKTERLSASWENFKVSVGKAANETGLLGGAIDGLSASLDLLGSRNLTFWDKLAAMMGGVGGMMNATIKDIAINAKKASDEQKNQTQVIREVDRAYAEFNGNLEAYSKAISTHILKTQLLEEFQKRLNAVEQKKAEGIQNIANLEMKLADLNERKKLQIGQALEQTNQEIKAIQKKIEVLNQLGVVEREMPNKMAMTTKKKTGSDFMKDVGVSPGQPVTGQIPNMEAAQEAAILYMNTWDEIGVAIENAIGNIAVNAINALGDAFGDLIKGQKASFKDFIKIILSGLRDVITGLLAKAIAEQIASNSKLGIVGLALAAVGIGAVIAMFNSKVPKFEHGGVNRQGGLSLVGERGAELVNLPRGSRVYNKNETMRMLSGSGFSNMRLEAVVSGEQLRFILKETDRRRGF